MKEKIMNNYLITTKDLQDIADKIINEHYKKRKKVFKHTNIDPSKIELDVKMLQNALKKYIL